MTLDEAKEIVDRMRVALTDRPTCERCIAMSHQWLEGAYSFSKGCLQWIDDAGLKAFIAERGFEQCVNRAGYIRPCDTCKAVVRDKRFPWADRLDAAKVMTFINTDPRCERRAFPLAILEETL